MVRLSANAQSAAAAEIATTLGNSGKAASPMGKLLAKKMESGELRLDSKLSEAAVVAAPLVGALLLPRTVLDVCTFSIAIAIIKNCNALLLQKKSVRRPMPYPAASRTRLRRCASRSAVSTGCCVKPMHRYLLSSVAVRQEILHALPRHKYHYVRGSII